MQRGYTLIELLVVIIILGILAAIALSTYSAFVIKARRAEAIVVIRSAMIAQTAVRMEKGIYRNTLDELLVPYKNSSSFDYKIVNRPNKSEIIGYSKIAIVGHIKGCVSDGYTTSRMIIGDAFQPLPECP